jgi:hypothetical protein
MDVCVGIDVWMVASVLGWMLGWLDGLFVNQMGVFAKWGCVGMFTKWGCVGMDVWMVVSV